MRRRISILALAFASIFTFTACDDKEDEVGPLKSGGTFTLAVPQIERSLAQTIYVSENNQHIYLKAAGSVSTDMFYSSDGGETFSPWMVYLNGNYIKNVNNEGTILTSGGAVISADGTVLTTFLSGYDYILGDKGKIFAFSQYGEFKYKAIGASEFQVLEGISVSAGNYKVVKIPGKGFAVTTATTGPTPTVSIYIVDEQTVAVTSYSFAIDRNQINKCNNLNAFLGYNFQMNNILVVKGCSGMAICNLANLDIQYVDYPDWESAVYTDLRDYPVQMDSEGNFYVMFATYVDSTRPKVYRYNGTEFSELTQFISDPSLGNPFIVNGKNLYFNSKTIQGTSIAGMSKLDISSGNSSQLAAVSEPMPVLEAVAIDENNFLLIADGDLFKYTTSTSELTRYDRFSNVSHVNILSDGRWVVGASSKLHTSTNKGSTWEVSENIFESTGNSYAINETRLVGGEILVVGTNQTSYYNQSTGMLVKQYDNASATGNGTVWSDANYIFPSNFQLAAIGPDGVIYGSIDFIDPFTYQTSAIPYVVRPGVNPEESTDGIPTIITDSGDQISLKSLSSYELEIQTRGSNDAEWRGTGSKFMSQEQLYGGYKLRLANNILTLVYHSEVYALK